MPQALDSEALQALLQALGENDAVAGRAYEKLRLRLIRFFQWNRCPDADELADKAFDRLAEKLKAGSESILDPGKYIAGIARMLIHESLAGEIRQKKMLAHVSWWRTFLRHEDHVQQQREDVLSHCLDQFSVENRQILERYYTGDASERIRNRQFLAMELELTLNALRNRVLRMRRQLEDCTVARLSGISRRDGFRPTFTNNRGKTLS